MTFINNKFKIKVYKNNIEDAINNQNSVLNHNHDEDYTDAKKTY